MTMTPEERRKRDEAATRAFVRLCEKAKCLLDSPRAFDPEWMLERLRRYKAARGYSLPHVARVIQDYRSNCDHEPRPAQGPHECPDCGVRSYGLGFIGVR